MYGLMTRDFTSFFIRKIAGRKKNARNGAPFYTKRFPPQTVFDTGTTGLAGQRLTRLLKFTRKQAFLTVTVLDIVILITPCQSKR